VGNSRVEHKEVESCQGVDEEIGEEIDLVWIARTESLEQTSNPGYIDGKMAEGEGGNGVGRAAWVGRPDDRASTIWPPLYHDKLFTVLE
jgi:hypothetical protein